MTRHLTIACGDYDRTHALVDGTVRAEGIELNWLDLPHLEIWTRMLNHYDFHASEMSLASYVIAKTLNKPLVGIPVFPGRAFRHSYIFVNAGSGIKEPGDLMGRRVGLDGLGARNSATRVRHRSEQDQMVYVDGREQDGDAAARTVRSPEN
jgi:hypothetical protein